MSARFAQERWGNRVILSLPATRPLRFGGWRPKEKNRDSHRSDPHPQPLMNYRSILGREGGVMFCRFIQSPDDFYGKLHGGLVGLVIANDLTLDLS